MEKLLCTKESKIWNFPVFNEKDDSITKLDYIKVYEDNHGSSILKDARTFSFTTDNEDIWFLPYKSYLKVQIYIRKEADGSEYTWNTDAVDISHNAFNIFKEARYYIADQEIERIDHVGISTMLYLLLKNQENYYDLVNYKYQELNLGGDVDSRKAFVLKCSGVLNVILPIHKIFPFLDQNRHVFRGVKHSLRLTLNDSNALMFRPATSPAGKVYVNKAEWMMPHVEPSLSMMAKLETQLALQNSYKLYWSAVSTYKIQPPKTPEVRLSVASTIHKPTNVFIAFQKTTRETTQTENSMVFDHLSVESVSVEVNSLRFPDSPLEADFDSYNYGECFSRFLDAVPCDKYFPYDYGSFKTLFPIWHIDISKHKPELYDNSSFPTINVYIRFKTAPAADYYAWVILYNDREATLDIDQKKMLVIR